MSRSRSNTTGFSLVELLVAMAIVGVLVALLLPAVQGARAMARRSSCQSRLRQQALAVLIHADTRGGVLPALWRTDRENTWDNLAWRIDVLDELEQSPLRGKIDLRALPLDAANLAVGRTMLGVFQCPATPLSPRTVDLLDATGLAGCDYAAVFDVFPTPDARAFRGAWSVGYGADGDGQVPGTEISPDAARLFARTRPSKLKSIRDGLSRTVLLVEQAGKPTHYRLGQGETPATPSEGAWITGEMASFAAAGVNRDNLSGIYGFHSVANVAMCDGSARMLAAETEWGVIAALLTSIGDEIIGDSDWR